MTTPSTKNVDRWLLPDGIGEVLPEQAMQVETLRRKLLDLYQTWGYELVIPPLMEFTESLLISANRDIDLQTFKVTDQLSGRTMGIRADITPQTARIDAHSLNRNGPARLCYAGSVLHTRPVNALASRSPIQVGAECFGIQSLQADIEIISLMLATLETTEIPQCCLSLGHVEVFRSLITDAGLSPEQSETLLALLQRKANPEIQDFLQSSQLNNSPLAALGQLNGDESVLQKAREVFQNAPAKIMTALDELQKVADIIRQRFPNIKIHFDLAELPGFHYHTGIVFAAYAEGAGAAVANGGRYDAVGEVFGRPRPATGFNADLKTLIRLGSKSAEAELGILACLNEDPAQWQAISALRQQGERVVCVVEGEHYDATEMKCNRQLVPVQNQDQQGSDYVVKPV